MNGVNLLVDSHAHVALGRVLSHDPFLPINSHFLFERYIDYESCIMVEILIVVLVYVVFFTTDGNRISRRDRNERGSFRRIFAFFETRPTRVIAISSKDESFRRRVLRGISSL